jgi:hypothetical protein
MIVSLWMKSSQMTGSNTYLGTESLSGDLLVKSATRATPASALVFYMVRRRHRMFKGSDDLEVLRRWRDVQ